MSKNKPPGLREDLFYRFTEFEPEERAKVNTETRTVPLTFSSESVVRRWWGYEVLSHKPECVMKGRASSVLFNHNPDNIVGPFSGERYENGKGFGIAGFDETPEGDIRMKQVQSGSLRGVSSGYLVEKFRKLLPGEEFEVSTRTIVGTQDMPTYVAVRWAPVEVTLTPIPADPAAHIGRSLDGIEIEASPAPNAEPDHTTSGGETTMNEEEKRQAAIDEALKRFSSDQTARFRKLLDRSAALGMEGLCFRLISEGKTDDEITDELFREVAKGRGKPQDGGSDDDAVGSGTRTVKVDQITDDVFARAFTDPVFMVIE
jgi:hypothetical protein